jgi:hypothetical protein
MQVDDMERAWQWLFTVGNGMLCTCGHVGPVPKRTDLAVCRKPCVVRSDSAKGTLPQRYSRYPYNYCR